jgi:multicomponent Na+:H+ antiporter subunit B
MINRLFIIPEIINFQLASWLLMVILIMLVVISIKLIFCNSLLKTMLISSMFSLLIGLSYLLMDAPDVAMTEVALAACLSSCVFLGFLSKLPTIQKVNLKPMRVISSSIICVIFIVVLTFAGLDLLEYGYIDSPLQNHLTKYYIEHTKSDIGIPSFVAALLASYRGYDTLGETAVILIAGISILLLFSQKNTKDA